MSSASIATSAAGCCAYERVKKESELRAATKATAAARVSTRLLVMGRSSDVAEGADATTARFGAAGSSPVHRFQAMLHRWLSTTASSNSPANRPASSDRRRQA